MSLWSCPTCPKSFARKGDLTRHKLIHTGVKPHVCETCGRGFTQYSGLKTHWNVHSKAKPYVCGVGTCTKAFGDPSSRTRHRKETHRRQGAYKCIISDCGTRIKRRSAFMAHLRKHGLDPKSIDLNAIVQRSNQEGISASSSFATPDVENQSHHGAESRSVSPSSFSDSPISDNGGEASRPTDNSEPSGDNPFEYSRSNWSAANDASLLDSVFERTMNAGLSGHPYDIYAYWSNNFQSSLYLDGILPAPVDYPLLAPLLPSLPILAPSFGSGSDGSQSSWSSPSPTYSTLYTADYNDDTVSLPIATDVWQEPPLYNFM